MYGQDRTMAAAAAGLGMTMAQIKGPALNTREPQPAPKPELEEYLDRLHSVIDRAEGLAQQVLDRTERVLRPASPSETEGVGAACGPSTLYGQQVQHAIIRVAGVSERLQNMLDRLEA